MATSTDNKLNSLVINRMTKTVYDSQTTLNNGEIYLVDPQFVGNRILTTNAGGEIIEADCSIADIPDITLITNAEIDAMWSN